MVQAFKHYGHSKTVRFRNKLVTSHNYNILISKLLLQLLTYYFVTSWKTNYVKQKRYKQTQKHKAKTLFEYCKWYSNTYLIFEYSVAALVTSTENRPVKQQEAHLSPIETAQCLVWQLTTTEGEILIPVCDSDVKCCKRSVLSTTAAGRNWLSTTLWQVTKPKTNTFVSTEKT